MEESPTKQNVSNHVHYNIIKSNLLSFTQVLVSRGRFVASYLKMIAAPTLMLSLSVHTSNLFLSASRTFYKQNISETAR